MQVVTSSSGDVIGKVVGVSHWLGVLTVFVSHWYGKVVLILIPCLILIVSEARNIVRTLRGDDGSDGSDRTPRTSPGSDSISGENLFRRHRW